MLKLTGKTLKALVTVEVIDDEGRRAMRQMNVKRLLQRGLPVEVLEGGTVAPLVNCGPRGCAIVYNHDPAQGDHSVDEVIHEPVKMARDTPTAGEARAFHEGVEAGLEQAKVELASELELREEEVADAQEQLHRATGISQLAGHTYPGEEVSPEVDPFEKRVVEGHRIMTETPDGRIYGGGHNPEDDED